MNKDNLLMQELLEKAIEIALKAHKGKVDKGDYPYILHPLRVMNSVNTIEEKIVALLHDVIEESSINIEYLRKKKFPEMLLKAIDLLTRHDNQTYDDYILQIKKNKLTTTVKIADIKDNMNIERLKSITKKDKERLLKYKNALETLIN